MWCKLRLKSFTASLGRMLHQSCLVSKCTVCLLKVATQRCFPLWIKKLFSCVVLNLYCYIRAAKGKDDSLLVLGQTWVSRKNPVVALFPVALNDMRRDAVSHTGQLTAYMKQWPSLWQDQGITLNPPDRCHMHARAHKYTRKQKWWRREGGSKTEGDINLKKTKKNTLSHTQSSGHCLYCCGSVQNAHTARCHARFPTMHMGSSSIRLHLNTLSPLSTGVCVNLTCVASMCVNCLCKVR